MHIACNWSTWGKKGSSASLCTVKIQTGAIFHVKLPNQKIYSSKTWRCWSRFHILKQVQVLKYCTFNNKSFCNHSIAVLYFVFYCQNKSIIVCVVWILMLFLAYNNQVHCIFIKVISYSKRGWYCSRFVGLRSESLGWEQRHLLVQFACC